VTATTRDVKTPANNTPHVVFETLLPHLLTHARITFRFVTCPGRRADLIAEVTALAWRWLVRLHQRGKDVMQFPVLFIRLVTRGVRNGRRLCHQERAKDVLSPVAQYRHRFRVESLESIRVRDHEVRRGLGVDLWQLDDTYEERLRNNTVTPPSDAAAFRIDFPLFLRELSERDRRLAAFLSLGNSAKEAASSFGLSPPRVTQLRQRWCQDWRASQGEHAGSAVHAPAVTDIV
jgi:hypothetical protein